jgi:hypothetical protein
MRRDSGYYPAPFPREGENLETMFEIPDLKLQNGKPPSKYAEIAEKVMDNFVKLL